jgi:hypothetical protein
LAEYKEDERVQCASPIFMLIAYYLGFTNRKRKKHRRKDDANIKKQTDIDRHGLKLSSNTSQLTNTNPPHFSLVTTFKIAV